MSVRIESAPGGTTSRGPAGAGVTIQLLRYLPAMIVLTGALVIWEVATSGPGRHVLPPPSAILGAFAENEAVLRRSAQATFYESLGGLVIGTAAGIMVALVSSRWSAGRRVLLPVAIASSAIPIVAVAPILNNWFGVLNPLSKMGMAALLVFFPIMINVTRGLVEVPPAALELMRSYASSDRDVLFKVRVPNMLPFFFTALKVSTTLAFIGAIVGEFFGGTSDVLGRVVIQSLSSGRFDTAWAGIFIGSAGAILSYLVVVLAERLVIPWYRSVLAAQG